ncbi:MAG TPA: hypothetical protein VHH15_12875, partial [Actinophytocola sp.]|nr:hypothetical protein [Actinophytocola sp.]
AVLIGAPEVGPVVAGAVFSALFLVFAVAVVAAAGALAATTLQAAGAAMVVVVLLGVLGALTPLGTFLPNGLATAPGALLRDETDVADLLPAAGVTVVLTVALLWLAVHATRRRQL